MNAAFICSACRHRIQARVRIDPVRQWRSAATFVSLSNIGHERTSKPSGLAVAGQKKKRDRVSPGKRTARAANPGDFLESLFMETLKPEAPFDPDIAPLPGTTAKTYEDLEILRQMLVATKEPIHLAWKFLLANFGPDAPPTAPSRSLPASFRREAGVLLKRLREEKRRTTSPSELPSVAEICQVFTYLQVFKHDTWDGLVVELLDNLSTGPAVEVREELASELLEAWQVLGRLSSRVTDTQPFKRKDWDFLLPPPLQQHGKEGALQGLFGRFPPHINRRKTIISLLTFSVFADCSVGTLGGAYKHNRFMDLLSYRIAQYPGGVAKLRSVLLRDSTPVDSRIVESLGIDWSKVSEAVSQGPDLSGQAMESQFHPLTEGPDSTSPGKHASKHRFGTIRRKLTEALKRRDVAAIDKLWQASHSMASAELCNQFILSYSSLRYPNSAIDVWNHMVEASIPPTLATWNVMLEGCRASRSPVALEGVWAKMLTSGAQPDVVCWTTRINGLADCGKTQQAVHALEDMGRSWLEAVTRSKIKDLQNAGDIDGIIKPTTSVINATVHGLVRQDKNQEANDVMTWAAKLGIKPDLITFNILLKPLVREGRTDAVQALLKHMQSLGIQADTTTFTTVLDEVIRDAPDDDPAEKTKAINNLLDQMAAAGLATNLHIYGKIISNLLHSSSSVDLSAVQAVLARMATEGLEPTMYIYTMLITHHFSRDPPDIEAARSLAEHVRLSKTVVDHVFWDRMIEGYARAGYSSAALAVMGRVDREGKKVGWHTLTELLHALVRNGEDETARQVVRNIRLDRGGPQSADVKGADGQHEFWDFAASYDLLGREE